MKWKYSPVAGSAYTSGFSSIGESTEVEPAGEIPRAIGRSTPCGKVGRRRRDFVRAFAF